MAINRFNNSSANDFPFSGKPSPTGSQHPGNANALNGNARVGVGSFLVASPKLNSTPFEKTVMLILQDNDQGTFGVVLNRPANPKIKLAWEELSGSSQAEEFIVQGGPIGGPVFAIHRDVELAEIAMPGGLFVSADSEKISVLTSQLQSERNLFDQKADFRIVFGVSGWKPGELVEEIVAGNWIPVAADSEHAFDDPTYMWENFYQAHGRQVFSAVTGIQQFPADPWMN